MKKFLKPITCIAILLGLFSFLGCNSFEPSKPSDTLLIGQLSLEAKGFQDYSYIIDSKAPIINGNHPANVVLVLRNKDTQKTYAATTEKSGAFYLQNPEQGSYVIEKLIYLNHTTLGWESIDVPKLDIPVKQPVTAGKVYIMGVLHWNAWVDPSQVPPSALPTLKNSNSGLATLLQDSSFDKVKTAFTEIFPKSLWLQKEWVNLEITPLSQPANVRFNYGSGK